MLKSIRVSFITIFLVSLFIFLFTAVAESQDAAKVVSIKGGPKIMKVNTNEWVDCTKSMIIDNGDRIKTLGDELVEISFTKNNSNVISVNENSDVMVRKGNPPYSIDLLNGEVMALINGLPPGSTFEISTPAGLSGARGTGWRSKTTGERSTFSAFENSIYAKGIDNTGKVMEGELIVKNGLETVIDRFEIPEKLEKISERDTERWNGWKEGLADRLKGSAENAAGAKGTATIGTPAGTQAPVTQSTEETAASEKNTAVTEVMESRAERANIIEKNIERQADRQSDVSETRDTERLDTRTKEDRDTSTATVNTGGQYP